MRRRLLILCLALSACNTPQRPAAAPHTPEGATDRPLDLSVDGEGYFIVQTTAGGYLFTRRGALSVSSTGELINEDGYKLYPVITMPGTLYKVTVTPGGQVQTRTGDNAPETAGEILLVRFPNDSGLERDGDYRMPTASSGDPITGKPGNKGLGMIVSGRIAE